MSRPKKLSNFDLPDGWQKKITEAYDSGASDTEIMAIVSKMRGGFSKTLWNAWLRDHPEFVEVIENGRVLSQAWWEKKGKSVSDRTFNSVLWYMNMKNRFGWSDEKGKDTQPVKIEMKIEMVDPKAKPLK
jgi:hypothetical protein